MQKSTELIKTGVFLLVAVLITVVGFALTRSPVATIAENPVGGRMFTFDPLKADNLEIVEFNETTAAVKPLRVQRNGQGLWQIPSHSDYPADADKKLGEAAAVVSFIQRGTEISNKRGDHEEFGVVDPTKEVRAGIRGVGTRVTISEGGKDVAALIIGKQADKDRQNLRYVRVAGEDNVYIAQVDLSKLSTKFEDWIEVDLLKLQAFDIKEVMFDNHTIVNNSLSPGENIRLTHDDGASDPAKRWEMAVLERKAKDFVPVKLKEGEELNSEALDALKTALDDLKIVDVRRKPKDLALALQGKGTISDNSIFLDMQNRGYFVAETSNGTKLFSKQGEVLVWLKDGIGYSLRFGDVASTGESKDDKTGAVKQDVNRYLFVQALFDPSRIPEPVYEPLPGEPVNTTPAPMPPAATGEAPAATPEKPAEKPAEPAAPATPEKPSAEKPAAETPAPATPEKPSAEKPAELAAPAAEKPPEAPAPATEKPAEEKPAESATDNAAAYFAGDVLALANFQDAPAPAAPVTPPAATTPAPAPAATTPPAVKTDPAAPATPNAAAQALLEKQRKEIERINAARKREYEQKLKDGKKKEEELNARFADWYYVINSDVYSKIHLSKKDLIRTKAPAPGQPGVPGDAELNDDTPQAFEALKQGLGK